MADKTYYPLPLKVSHFNDKKQRCSAWIFKDSAQHNLPAKKKRIRTNDILHYELKVAQSNRAHRFLPW